MAERVATLTANARISTQISIKIIALKVPDIPAGESVRVLFIAA
jgi:hypothetical protein